MTLFAEDNYVICWNKSVQQVIIDMKKEIQRIIKWLRQSSLKVNDSKTQLCFFHRKDHPPILITILNETLTSRDKMNALGIMFNSTLQWHYQLQNAINKSKISFNAIYLIKLLDIITSNYYSVLC